MKTLEQENEEFQDEYTSIQSEKETLAEEVTSLKADNKAKKTGGKSQGQANKY